MSVTRRQGAPCACLVIQWLTRGMVSTTQMHLVRLFTSLSDDDFTPPEPIEILRSVQNAPRLSTPPYPVDRGPRMNENEAAKYGVKYREALGRAQG